ncbi:MAG: ATP-binding protein [Pseudoclavibacter sp.]
MMQVKSGRRIRSLGTRFFIALSVTLIAVTAAIFVVSAIAGPMIFHAHLAQADLSDSSTVVMHAEEAFQFASTISLGAGIIIAIAVAMVVFGYLASRMNASLSRLESAATSIADGDYTVELPRLDIGSEFETVGVAFNDMAHRLRTIEESRRRLFSDLAHELRTPISTIQAQVEGIEDGVVATEASLPVLTAQVTRLTRLSEDVVLLSRAEEHSLQFDFEVGSVGDLVEETADGLVLPYRDKGVTLRLDRRSTPDVVIDRVRLGQVVSILLTNALTATDSSGSVNVAVTQPDVGHIMVKVRDTGIGIGPDQLSHVFERFYRVDQARDRDHGGFGIGLAIAHAIVEGHHGRITAASDGPNRGSSFTILLPTMH